MGRLHNLAESILMISGTNPAIVATPQYAMGLRWLRDGVLPNGMNNTRPALIAQLGDAQACELVRLRQEALEDGAVRFEVRFEVHPSRAGGAGLSVDGAMTEFFMAYAEDTPCSDDEGKRGLAAALRTVLDERGADIQAAFRSLLVPDDFIWRLVGWAQRDRWHLEQVAVDAATLGDAWIEENRGENWLAKHWEVWVPVTLDVTATMRRKP